jgi:TRAP-type C4-dicarboxylate transport system permease small subunit
MLSILDRALKHLLWLLVAILTASVFLQVLSRFVFKYPLPWTEEISRIAFVYSIFVGATIAVRENTHLNIDILLVVLPKGLAQVITVFGSVLVGVFLGFVTWEGTALVLATGIQMTPVMQIPFRYLYLVVPASGAFMLLYLVLGIIDYLRKKGQR